jgi:hypothetical protein
MTRRCQRTKHRGIRRVAGDFLLNLIAYNLVRIPKLVPARWHQRENSPRRATKWRSRTATPGFSNNNQPPAAVHLPNLDKFFQQILKGCAVGLRDT